MSRIVKVPMFSLVALGWALIGLIVALNEGYGDIDSGSEVWTLLLSIVLWPLVLAGADVSIRF